MKQSLSRGSFKSNDTRGFGEKGAFSRGKIVHVGRASPHGSILSVETGTNDPGNAPPGGFKGKYRKCLLYPLCLTPRGPVSQFEPFAPFWSLCRATASDFYLTPTGIFRLFISTPGIIGDRLISTRSFRTIFDNPSDNRVSKIRVFLRNSFEVYCVALYARVCLWKLVLTFSRYRRYRWEKSH